MSSQFRSWATRGSAPIALGLAVALLGCADLDGGDASDPDAQLDLAISPGSITGSFVHAGTTIAFTSESITPAHAELSLDLDGAAIDVSLDYGAQRFREDGHLNALYDEDLAALLALRDALIDSHPELVNELHGRLLVREVDRLAEAPIGLTLDRHDVDLAAGDDPDRADSDGCGGDGTTCLPGKSGTSYAVYDPGADGICVWQATSYGGSECAGRCGAGCNWLDNDYTWDCLDHDRCVDAYGGGVLSGNANCGDEFWDASDDYTATLAPLCFGGSTRSAPPSTPPPPPPPTTPTQGPTGTAKTMTATATGSLPAGDDALSEAFSVLPGTGFIAAMTGTGDPDLYVRFNAPPTVVAWDCRPFSSGASETCSLIVPASASVAFVDVRAFTAATFSLQLTWVEP